MALLCIRLFVCLICVSAPCIGGRVLGYEPNRGRLTQRFLSPRSSHLLGTDDFGRDTMTRLIYAARVSLSIGFMVAAISLTLGVAFGLLAGYYGGWIDDVINALIQLVF